MNVSFGDRLHNLEIHADGAMRISQIVYKVGT
jgi:hypothetical protein